MAGRYSFRGDIRRYSSKPELNKDDFSRRYAEIGKPWSSNLASIDSMPSLMRPWPSMSNTTAAQSDFTQSTQLFDLSQFNTSPEMPRPYRANRSSTGPMFPTSPTSNRQGCQHFPHELPPTLDIPKGGYPADFGSENNSPRLLDRKENFELAQKKDIPAAPNRPLPEVPSHGRKDVLPVGAVATPYLAAANDLKQAAASKKRTKDNSGPTKPSEPTIPEEEVMQGGGSLGRNSSLKSKKPENGQPPGKKLSSASTDGVKKVATPESPSLASKLSKSFYDLASGDRLKNWKNKLPSVRKQYPSNDKINKDQVDWEVSPLSDAAKGSKKAGKPAKDALIKAGDDSTYDLAQNYWKADKNPNAATSQTKHSSLREQRWRRQGDPVFRSQVTLSDTDPASGSGTGGGGHLPERRNSQHGLVRTSVTQQDTYDLEALLAEVATEDPNLVAKKEGSVERRNSFKPIQPAPTSSSTAQARASFLAEFTAASSPSMEHRTKKQPNCVQQPIKPLLTGPQLLYEEVDLPWQPPPPPVPPEPPHYANAAAMNSESEYGPLPPPARITPYSGMPVPFTKEGSLVKPIAFKPIVPANHSENPAASMNRPRGCESLSDTYYTYSGQRAPQGRVNGASDTEVTGYGREKSSTPKYLSDNELILGASANTTYNNRRQPFKVTAEPISRAPRQAPPYAAPNNRGQKKTNGDYDIVPDFATEQENRNTGAENSRGYPNGKETNGYTSHHQSQQHQQQHHHPHLHKPVPTNGTVSFAETSGGGTLGKDRDSHQSSGYGTVGGGSGSYGSRHSGIHVTPSPSDSGVAELEAALRDRETELAQLRMAMESNEQAVVRVYQEKEDRWHGKLQEWAARLDQAVQAEQRLLSQVQRLQDERLEMQMTVQTLNAEKHGLQRKCKELETDYFAMKDRLQSHERHWAICRKCGDIFLPSEAKKVPSPANGGPLHQQQSASSSNHVHSSTAFPLLDNHEHNQRADRSRSRGEQQPSPSPSPAGTMDPEIKSEIDMLRHEVHELRDSLTHQISAFAQERNRWDEEKRRVLDYQRALQDNYAHVVEKNAKLERRSSLAPDDTSHENNL